MHNYINSRPSEQIAVGPSVCKMQTVDLNPVGGLDRLRASGVHLSNSQLAAIRQSQTVSVDQSIPVTLVWPTGVETIADGSQHITGITKCSLCDRLHYVGLNANPLRVPECSTGLPPFHNGREKPDLVRILPILDSLPEAFLFEMKAERSDLLTFAKLAYEIEPISYGKLANDVHKLRSLARYRRAERWLPRHSEQACIAIIRSRVLDERISIIANDLDLPGRSQVYTARRLALAEFIRRHGPGPMRLRFARALENAWQAAGRGEL